MAATGPAEDNPNISQILEDWLFYNDIQQILVGHIDPELYTPIRGIHRSGINKLKYVPFEMN